MKPIVATIIGLLACVALPACCAQAADAIRVHPDNPRYFLFRGKPLVLITATEHYGSVINRPFDFERYLVDHAEKRQTLTRTFLLYRELQSSHNPWSPCKPESPDYIAPWPRTGSEGALDGLPQFDLDQWNPEFFERLHRFLSRSSELGVVVELTLFSSSYNDQLWQLNPLNPKNNVQGVGPSHFARYLTLQDEKLNERQLAYVRKIVQETAKYDNVYYEVCNEPSGEWGSESTLAQVDAWQAEVAMTVRAELKTLNAPHLVAGSPVYDVAQTRQAFDDVIRTDLFDVINFHSHPDLYHDNRRYDLGRFMAKDLVLPALGDFCAAVRAAKRPFVFDEDNAASAYKDDEAWTIERKRAWTTVLGGGHYDCIDFSILVGRETGTPESGRKIRTWMKNLSELIHSFDFVRAEPTREWIEGLPAHVHVASLARAGEDYVAYFADARERKDAGAGEPVQASVSMRLPDGAYVAWFYSPVAGAYSPGVPVKGGAGVVSLEVPEFRHDLVLRVTRKR